MLSGSLEGGQIIVDVQKEDLVRLVLNGAAVSCTYSAPLYVKQADKVVLILAPESENSFSDGSSYLFGEGEDEPSAAIFSKDDLTITGSGALSVTGNYQNGITSKDDLVITGGQLTVSAVNHGIRGKDSVAVLDGVVSILSGNDGIKSANSTDEGKGWVCIDGGSFTIESAGDAIQAETDLTINAGSFSLTAGGGADNAEAHSEGGYGGGPEGRGPGGAQQPPSGDLPDAASLPTPEPAAVSGGSAEASVGEENTPDSFKGLKAGTLLTVNGGSFQLDCADDAIHANGDISIAGGSFSISTGDDGFHADETLLISGDETLLISGGETDISRSYEGLEGSAVEISGGSVTLMASDDGVNAAGGSDGEEGVFGADRFSSSDCFIRITGGSLWVDAGGDGLDSNGDIIMEGGTVLVNGPTNNGNGALDYAGEMTVSGGTLAAAGSSGMAQSPGSGSAQPSLTVFYSSSQPSGTLVSLTDPDGNLIFSFTPSKEYQSIVISTPQLATETSYTLSSGGSISGSTQNGLYEGGELSGAAKLCTAALTDTVSRISDSGSSVSGGMGGTGGKIPGARPSGQGGRPAGEPPSAGFSRPTA